MARSTTLLLRALAIALPTALGITSVLYSDTLRQSPAAAEVKRPPTAVRVMTVTPIDMVPHVIGYGLVAPVREWRAVARVPGEIIETAKGLAPGAVMPAGTLLFRIDDSDLRLDLAQIDAQLASSRLQDDTISASLALAQADLSLMQTELARQQTLAEQGVVTQATLEATRRQELTARTKHLELTNQRALNVANRGVLATQRASVERALGFTEIRAPYELRLTEVTTDLGQFVGAGQTLLSAEGTAAVDIAAQFPIGRMGPLLRLAGEGTSALGLRAQVRIPTPDHTVIWPAKVERVGEAIDAQTQSAAIVVRVTDPLGQSVAGERPPLRRNMFVEVMLFAPKSAQIVVPSDAVRDGTALVVAAEGTLEKRKVVVGFTSDDIAVVTQGLSAGDVLVVTDPTIAVPGMAVKPIEDTALIASLAAAALGTPAGTPVPGSGGGAGAGSGMGKKSEPQE
ncbi:HlyD family efflux transporter periplasmic adaptor subunit [Celeribacter baekdonensis]|uniref:efflux RND transporter periplasmic adaptor subunit n=1 Tax=Celeribacter baekdonensis TaxID=875171 RepID=UPI0030D8457A|tara:strand:+ start:213234 stop:214598 length:1365 start_codon:yes stop_codon:yes gene_type:complete